MAEQRPKRGLSAADIVRFLAALLTAIGLGSLINYFRHGSLRSTDDPAQPHHDDMAAAIESKRRLGHEPTNVRLGTLVAILIGSAVFAAIIGVALWALLYVLATRAQQADVPLSPLATAGPPPEPRLQADPPADWQRMRATDEAILNSAGRSPDGSYHIPIDRAMDLLAQRGLPVAASRSEGLSYDAAHNLESSGGQPPGGIPGPASPAGTAATSSSATSQPSATAAPSATPTPARSTP